MMGGMPQGRRRAPLVLALTFALCACAPTRFILRDPETSRALPDISYRLFRDDGKGHLIVGRTDAEGKTKGVRTASPERYVLLNVVGDGDYGTSFVLQFEGSPMPVAGRCYRITMEDGRVITGRTDGSGNTKYVTGDGPEKAHLDVFEAGEGPCDSR